MHLILIHCKMVSAHHKSKTVYSNVNENKKLSCRSETARRFVSLNILLTYSRPLEMTMLSRACLSPYWYFIETIFASRTVYDIFSVKE